MPGDVVRVRLNAEPRELSMADRSSFRISLHATNPGTSVVNPELHDAQLLVNGQESASWSLAVGNGKREDKWFALPPGESVEMTWSSLGPVLFPEPQDYQLVLEHQGQSTEPITIKVVPDQSA